VNPARGIPHAGETAPIVGRLAGALVALDFDGTLAAISPLPDDVRIEPGATTMVRNVHRSGALVAIVTGRTVESVLRAGISEIIDLPGLIIYGLHGAERWEDGVLDTPGTPPGIALLRESLPTTLRTLTPDPALWVEDKRISLVVHTRLTADPDGILDAITPSACAAAEEVGLVAHVGKEVVEISLPDIDKGVALRALLSSSTTAAYYAGDDFGDLPAFHEVHAWSTRTGKPGVRIGVVSDANSPVTGHVDVEVCEPGEVVAFFNDLVTKETPPDHHE